MTDIYLGLGSNVRPDENLRLAIRELDRRFDLRGVSAVYRNAPVGFEGDDFLNAVAVVSSGLPAAEVCRQLEEIHGLAGRKRGEDAFVSRTLDIDLLLYGDAVIPELRIPREDVLAYGFVLRPLAEIAPSLVHPVTGRTLAEHWREFDDTSHPMTRDALDLS